MNQKRIILFLCVLLLMPIQLLASIKPVNLGTLTKSAVKIHFQNESLETYKAFDLCYIPVTSLKTIGCQVAYDNTSKSIQITAPLSDASTTTSSSLQLESKNFQIYNGKVTINHFNTTAIVSNNTVLIPIGALRACYNITLNQNDYFLTPINIPSVSVTDTTISNQTNTTLTLNFTDIYYRNDYIYKKYTYTIAPNTSIQRNTTSLDKNTYYITSIITNAKGDTLQYTNPSLMGQINPSLMKHYKKLTTAPVYLSTYGDPITLEQIQTAENMVNQKGLSSPTKYLVWTNIATQKTYIFEGSKNNWHLLKCFICSTGRNSTPTPKGTFNLTYKVPSFGQNHGYCCKNAFGFIGTTYLYHSILFDRTGSYLLEGRGVLGQKASQGCIRFSPENAAWFYNTLISGTTVWIN